MSTIVKTRLDEPVSCHDDLVKYQLRNIRPRDQWGVGVEVEKLVVDRQTGQAAEFSRIEALLSHLESAGGWQGQREAGRLIALMGESSSVTLEPGGQLELSGKLCTDLCCCQRDLSRHVRRIDSAARPLGLAFLGLGVHPITPLQDIDWLPKPRYAIMREYMLRTGDLGQHMMKLSAGLQVNLDFCDEADCMDKIRTGQLLAPLFYALFANSPLMNGKPSGFLSTRGEIWARTDPDRSGIILELFRPGAGLSSYVDYALDVPMYFILRQGHLIDLTRRRFSFRRYLSEGFEDFRPTLADWDLHLSTLFPEVRLRPQIELRSADSLPPHLAMAVAALAKGLMYDDEARYQVAKLLDPGDDAQRMEVYRNSWRLGLRTPCGNHTLREVACELLAVAREVLRRVGPRDCPCGSEARFLDGIEEVAHSGVTLAERLLQDWQGAPEQRLAALLTHCAYPENSPGEFCL
ncbi:gamma-glutamylcysteine synthetase [Syntrophotalea carbinolica DSM 2380]|uniref:Glutamate--cysteine ligase n=1 Tax=Syntrophotalea carbinolica (strain DSM 2380 / NBRC 103641 / GraBd1) TaxID=338963 RepID=Q39ZU6_SYNC1|nr:glutamate-cysteine ligase family protein [Syntrophotalea carbinolica]ABA90361.1 gamma-glutamylcysteine synthetase [Syntrophotalea carbinolica DSM 2380]